ncbi:hypothetical protein ERD78_18175 [Allopusillimonas soli]|uniref:Inner membrane protein n=1 Tax=Allopusillimonas soli TaxID=659016 RepID=A0A853FFX6_9BURK|nr:DUF6776 family protein [Allopusillimonas soli]NYT38779.1 hypothetical protein [Allopusillimonas soli]TEA70241.1 hypothetical protein ERD78_18175 [Allopusillimonas soli]
MFGSSRRPAFKPTAYGATRRPRRIPRWLVLMLTGVVLGAGGLLFLQKSYGPQRLTVEQSEQLHYDLNSLAMDKQRLQSQVTGLQADLNDTRSKLEAQTKELADAKATVQQQQKDIGMFAQAMPPDPRGTSPGIRAASFDERDGTLSYQFLVMQEEDKDSLFKGTAEFVAAGRYPNGRSGNIDLPAQEVSLERYTQVMGTAEMPNGFKPRQVTIRIHPEGSKKVVATRTILVR